MIEANNNIITIITRNLYVHCRHSACAQYTTCTSVVIVFISI